jgi:TIGR03009 family protein
MTQSARVSLRSIASLCAWLIAYSCVSPVFAQLDSGIAPKTDQGKQPRPNGAGTVLLGNPADPVKTADNSSKASNIGINGPTSEQLKKAVPPGYKITPELEALLTAWEKQSQNMQRLNGDFRLYTYDEVFQMETRAVGKFWYQSPDKGRMDFEKSDLTRVAKDKSGRLINPALKGPNGLPYEVKNRSLETWCCNGNEILQVFHEDKTFNRISIPQQYQGESIKESPLPFLFGLKKAEANERYLMQIGPMNGKIPGGGYKVPCIHVIAYPLREQDSREWSKAEVLLDSQTFLPQSIQTTDPAGTSRNVYAFAAIEVNARWLFKDPFTVPVSGYKLILNESAKPQQQSSVPNAPAAPKSGPLK